MTDSLAEPQALEVLDKVEFCVLSLLIQSLPMLTGSELELGMVRPGSIAWLSFSKDTDCQGPSYLQNPDPTSSRSHPPLSKNYCWTLHSLSGNFSRISPFLYQQTHLHVSRYQVVIFIFEFCSNIDYKLNCLFYVVQCEYSYT